MNINHRGIEIDTQSASMDDLIEARSNLSSMSYSSAFPGSAAARQADATAKVLAELDADRPDVAIESTRRNDVKRAARIPSDPYTN